MQLTVLTVQFTNGQMYFYNDLFDISEPYSVAHLGEIHIPIWSMFLYYNI